LKVDFPQLISDNRFTEFRGDGLAPPAGYIQTKRGSNTAFLLLFDEIGGLREPVNSTASPIYRHHDAQQNDFGLVYMGFKFHVTVSGCGEVLIRQATTGNINELPNGAETCTAAESFSVISVIYPKRRKLCCVNKVWNQ